ncbi:ligand-binding sensor domain-containing protein [Foetidibacter luteolus]|uniref:ligand-binding sensor domain-containing protein n=1 Tax=Foetidibacter luteolus TaxID=2608880 RepID=UPI00129BFCAE|nr:triple tyrosine motif-containing protein [Foetidibacter luteolus]
MKKLIFFIALLLPALQAFCQNTIGLPEIVNYPKQVFKAGTQNWDACQDANGLLYFANNEGLLSFDGTHWRLYPLPNKTIVRSLALGQDNRIYVGGQDELGYFLPDNNGQLAYHSLTALIPDNYRSFSDVWDIVSSGKQLFFRSNQKIFVYSNGKITVFPTRGEWLFMGLSHQGVVAEDEHFNLLLFEKGTWRPLLQNPFPQNCIITSAVVTGRDSTMITTLKNGIYLLNGSNCTRMSSPALENISSGIIYSATLADDNHIALATTTKGCFIIDKKGSLVQHFSRQEGLQDNNILSVFADHYNNLWLGLNAGIDYVAYNSPIKNIRPDSQNEGSGYSCIIHNNRLYIATSSGLYSASLAEEGDKDLSFVKAGFTAVNSSAGQVWNISVVNNQLLMGHHEGAYLVENNNATPLDKSSGFWTFLPLSSVLPSPTIIAGTYKGISFYNYQKGSFIHNALDVPFESARFVTIDDGTIWVSHPYKGVFKVSLSANDKPSVQLYAEKHGLSTQNNYIFKIKDRVVAATDKGIYEYNSRTDKFEPSAFFKDIFGKTIIRYLKEDNSGNVWFVFDKNLGVVDFSTGKPQTTYISELNNKLVSGFEHVYPVNDNNVFVGAEKGYFHINYAKYKQHHSAVKAHIREVKIAGKKDSILYYGYAPGKTDSQPQIPAVTYQWNSFHFEFSSPVYEYQANIEYSCYLEGHDRRWSDWNYKTEKEYTYLPAGTYRFFVKARNNLGVESVASGYSFVILPPWYQSWWAYAIYLCLGITAAWVAYRWQRKKFVLQQMQYEEKQKRLRDVHQLELEKNEKEIVKLRNEKLEAEINHKNKEMASATMHLVKKGELITNMKDELQRLTKNTEDQGTLDAIKKMIKTLDQDENMDADWEHFAVHFDKVHNDFFIALKKQHPNLTPNELKLCAYLRMNLSTKEMARLMNISVRGVEISRYRLRKKLQVATETNLFTYLLDIQDKGQRI